MTTVCVIGQGYVGLSVAAGAAAAGLTVHGIDTNEERIAQLAKGNLVVPGVREDLFAIAYASGQLHFSTAASQVKDAGVVLICVPTPVVEHRPDLSAIEAAAKAVGAQLRAGTLVILESTTYPGTTEQVVVPLLEAGSGLQAGRDFMVAYSPERIDPGNEKFDLRTTPRIVGGIDQASTNAAVAFYQQIVDDVHAVSSCRIAELAKLLENTYRMVNIALVNELAMRCEPQGISAWEVIDAAATKPFGFTAFYPGPGVGGHCIPLDPTYLTWQSRRDTGRPYRLVELAQDVNTEMPTYVATRIADALNNRGQALHGAKLLVLGVTYKPDVGDLRESAAVRVIDELVRRGAQVRFHDPFVEHIDTHFFAGNSVELDDKAFADIDLVALLTPHSSYDLAWTLDRSPLLFDARNAVGMYKRSNVVAL